MSLAQALKTRKEAKMKMNKCKYCFSKENLTLDHKIPLSRGGLDEPSNYQCLCSRCNTMKGSVSNAEVTRVFKLFLEINRTREVLGKKPMLYRWNETRR